MIVLRNQQQRFLQLFYDGNWQKRKLECNWGGGGVEVQMTTGRSGPFTEATFVSTKGLGKVNAVSV